MENYRASDSTARSSQRVLCFAARLLRLSGVLLCASALTGLPVVSAAQKTAGRMGKAAPVKAIEPANAIPADKTGYPNVKLKLAGYVQYDPDTCAEQSLGSWTIDTPPKDGKTSTGTTSGTLSDGTCPGVTFTFNTLFYTWTNLTTKDTTDSLEATWTASCSDCYADNVYTIDLAPTKLSLLDPYLLVGTGGVLSAQTAINSISSTAAQAQGLMADGTSAAVAVFKSTSSAKVTFTANNGATLRAFSSDFLNSGSGAGAASLSVTPTASGSSYYALALVIGGQPPAAKTGSQITVTAVSAGIANTQTQTLLAVPTPVVLIHGLWGDQTSLASAQAYLTKINSTYKANPFLLTPICYSVYLGFDAAADTLPGHGTGCEQTSTQALDKYLTATLYPQLDAKHWVGGRVDAVVHSMGGLVVRHYAATANFKSIRNRELGAFRNVITLDTPENGSALATWLDANAGRTRQVSSGTPYTLWTNVCGTSLTVTLQSCFLTIGNPLAFRGLALSTGAVASLIPGSAHITGAPAPAIFNTSYGKWYAVVSDYNDDDKPAALLRDSLNGLVAATYAKTPPTLGGILGTKDSDVIVTVASQTATAPSAQVAKFKDLEHTAAPFLASFIFPGDGNNSVTDYAAVNGTAAYWLGLQSSTTPQAEPATEADEAAAEFAPAAREAQLTPVFQSETRLKVDAPEAPVALGRPVVIPLQMNGARAARIQVNQRDASGREQENVQSGIRVGSGPAKIVDELGGVTTIEVTPLAAGEVDLTVAVLFNDGGLEQQHARLNVVPTAEGLERMELNSGFTTMALVLEENEEDRQVQLSPRLWYGNLEYGVLLKSLEGLKVEVRQPENDPVVRVDANGVVHALRAGRAVVTAELGGMRDSVTVQVYDKDAAPAGYRRVGEP